MINDIQEYKKLKLENNKSSLQWLPLYLTIVALYIFLSAVTLIKPFFLELSEFFRIIVCGIIAMISLFSFAYILRKLEYIFNKKAYIKQKNINKIYKGSLSEIFNFEDIETQEILKLYRLEIENDILINNGLSVKLILSLIDKIYLNKNLNEQELKKIENLKIKEEEKNALISANTRSGNMIKELRTIKS